jgi:hypothetical protein
MEIAIMQPYFFPYIGYFQLMNAVDQFVVYDNTKYTKKGWINRNRILMNGADANITLPLKKDADDIFVLERSLSESWQSDKEKLLNKIEACYRKAPYYKIVNPLIHECLNHENTNLFQFIFYSLQVIKEYLSIDTKLIISSDIRIDHSLKSEQKVLAICKALGANKYINPPGGIELYNDLSFRSEGLELLFLQPKIVEYRQFDHPFVPWLSIIDVFMFNAPDYIQTVLLKQFTLITK